MLQVLFCVDSFGIFGVIKGLAVSLGAMLAPLLANPITLIIAAIVAIIGGIIYIFKDEIMAKSKITFSFLKSYKLYR